MTTHTQAKAAGTPTWIDLLTPDIDAARTFYHSIFGWEYDIGGPEFGGYTTARVGDRSAAGMSGPQPGAPPMPAAWGLYFASDDLAADVARAQELGAQSLYPPMTVGDFGGMAGCADPTGAAFSFWQAGSHIGTQITDEPGSAAWFELYSPDAKKARDFYCALLGASADLMPGGMEYYVLKLGGTEIAGIMQIDPAWGDMPAMWATYFAVADIEKAVAEVTGRGGAIMGDIDNSPFGRIAAMRDPDGAVFKLIEVPAAA